MAYTTYTAVKTAFAFEYWIDAQDKFTEDGYAFTINPNAFTDESTFMGVFIDRTASFIDDSIGGGPFAASGLLESINRWLAVYEVEQYLLAANSDRVVSVTINEDKKRALTWLNRIINGDIPAPAPTTSNSTAAPALIEPTDDGVTLVIGDIEEDIILGGSSSATTIPEV